SASRRRDQPGDIDAFVLEVALGERDAKRHAIGRNAVVSNRDLLRCRMNRIAEQRGDKKKPKTIHGAILLSRQPGSRAGQLLHYALAAPGLRVTLTFLIWVQASSSSIDSSRPRPDCLVPPKGTPTQCALAPLIQT